MKLHELYAWRRRAKASDLPTIDLLIEKRIQWIGSGQGDAK